MDEEFETEERVLVVRTSEKLHRGLIILISLVISYSLSFTTILISLYLLIPSYSLDYFKSNFSIRGGLFGLLVAFVFFVFLTFMKEGDRSIRNVTGWYLLKSQLLTALFVLIYSQTIKWHEQYKIYGLTDFLVVFSVFIFILCYDYLGLLLFKDLIYRRIAQVMAVIYLFVGAGFLLYFFLNIPNLGL